MSDDLQKILDEEVAKAPLMKRFYWGKYALRAMARAYDKGRYDQRILDDLTSPAGKSQAGGG